MKMFLHWWLLLSGLGLCWLGFTHSMSTAHGIGGTELMGLEFAIKAPSQDPKEVEARIAVLRQRLHQANHDANRIGLQVFGIGALSLLFFPLAVSWARKLRKTQPNQSSEPTRGTGP